MSGRLVRHLRSAAALAASLHGYSLLARAHMVARQHMQGPLVRNFRSAAALAQSLHGDGLLPRPLRSALLAVNFHREGRLVRRRR